MDSMHSFSSPPFAGPLHTALSCVLAAVALALALRTKSENAADWRWLIVITALLTVGRWPSIWFPFGLNPDESQFLAGVHTLRTDPVFWRSVNGMTSGPFNVYALWPFGTVLGDGYLAARCTALVLLAWSFGAVHLTLARRFGALAARLATLPTVCFLSFTAHPDWTHYSSELVSVALISTAVYLSSRWVWEGITTPSRQVAIGVLLGMVPFAKPQATPLAFVVGGMLVTWAWFGLKSAGAKRGRIAVLARLVISALIPLGSLIVMTASHHVLRYALTAYIHHNTAYVETGEFSLARTAFQIFARLDPTCPIYFAWAGPAFIGGILALSWLRRTSRADFAFIAVMAVLVVVATVSAVTPGRPFPHYLMLIPVPWTLFLGALLGAQLRQRTTYPLLRVALPALSATMVAILIGVRAFMDYPPRAEMTPFKSDFSGRVTARIHELSRPNDAAAIWGWRPDYYVLAGLTQATRDAVTESCIAPGPFRAFFRAYFLKDFEHTRPALFIDGVGAGSFRYTDRNEFGHDAIFPELAKVIRQNYTLEADIDGSRIYVRNDRTSGKVLGAPR